MCSSHLSKRERWALLLQLGDLTGSKPTPLHLPEETCHQRPCWPITLQRVRFLYFSWLHLVLFSQEFVSLRSEISLSSSVLYLKPAFEGVQRGWPEPETDQRAQETTAWRRHSQAHLAHVGAVKVMLAGEKGPQWEGRKRPERPRRQPQPAANALPTPAALSRHPVIPPSPTHLCPHMA